MRNHAAAAAAGSGYSQPTCGWRPKHDGARGPITASIAPSASMPEMVAPSGASSHVHVGRQVQRDLLDASRLFVAAAHPVDVRRLHAVLVFQHGARPDVGGDLILRHADAPALQVLGPRDAAVGADIDRVVAERARRKHRHADIRTVAVRGLHREAAHRQFADVEIGVTEGTEEDLLRLQQHEHRIDAVDLHAAVDQRAHPVVVADRDGERELAHSAASPAAVAADLARCIAFLATEPIVIVRSDHLRSSLATGRRARARFIGPSKADMCAVSRELISGYEVEINLNSATRGAIRDIVLAWDPERERFVSNRRDH